MTVPVQISVRPEVSIVQTAAATGVAVALAAAPPPAVFTARTSKAYPVPFVRPDTVSPLTAPASVHVAVVITVVPSE